MASPARLVKSPSTDDPARSLNAEFRRLFAAATSEVFEHNAEFRRLFAAGIEHGMESTFSLRLASLIELHQELAIDLVSRFLAGGSLDKMVAMETLHQLGLSEHEPTYDARKGLLLQHLSSKVAMIRYGAMYGLSSMDDPGVIPEIAKAYKQETDPYLKKYMSAALEQLRETLSGA